MITLNPFVRHTIATDPLPPFPPALYEYVFAGNGIFLRAHRQGLSVLFPVLPYPIAGLPLLTPRLEPTVPLIPQHLMEQMLAEAFEAWRSPTGPLESLYHFTFDQDWSLAIPDQVRTAVSVQPTDTEHCPSYQTCLVEIHSHHEMRPQFSSMDDEDETGFRIYGVCGSFKKRPSITFRIGLYGHFVPIPASLIAELPPGLHDTYPQESLS
jgi:hypothetical protein